LQGDLPSSVGSLTSLEVLEVQSNKLTSLPNEIRQLMCLRVLNVSSNQLKTIPMELFETSLTELVANKNRLEGVFFTTTSAMKLQVLDLANNSLTSLCEGEVIELPALKSLNASTNRLTELPNLESWASLQTLLMGENKLKALPEGFTTLSQLRTADFTANDISQIDERVALMSLEHLTLAANPLRERKFLTMSFVDIKRDLSSRLAVEDTAAVDEEFGGSFEDTAEDTGGLQVTPSGTLDLSSKSLTELDEDTFVTVADSVRQLHLHQHTFESIPATLSHITFLTVLDLSKNSISVALTSHLSLPKLKDLRLNSNKITTFEPLTTNLAAPSLQTLDISNNHLTGILPAP
jgi:Leucine-rich repeat (LRR) protein